MSDPIRYSIVADYQAPWAKMHEFRSGEWVKWADYARLKAENDELTKDAEESDKEYAMLQNSKEVLKVVHTLDSLAIKKQKEEIDRLKSEVDEYRKDVTASVDTLIDERNRLKAEVERLKTVSTIEQRTIQGLQQTPEWSEIARLTEECRRLEAENSRLRSSSFVTAVPVEQYNRVVAGGELVLREWSMGDEKGANNYLKALVIWNAAKEGKPSV